MGLTRKIMSVSTLGAVDMRSDKERIARKTAKGARASKKAAAQLTMQTKLMQQQADADAAAREQALKAANRAAQAAAAIPTPVVDVADQLSKLAALRDQGVLTEEEFAAQKAKLLA